MQYHHKARVNYTSQNSWKSIEMCIQWPLLEKLEKKKVAVLQKKIFNDQVQTIVLRKMQSML
jgi:hypothetical protein